LGFAMTEATATAAAAPPRYTRANPFPAKLLVNRRLSGPESAKDTRHFELDLTGWGLSYEVGDSLAVYATNDQQLVDEIIHALGATGDEQVPRPKGSPTTFREALLRDYSVTQPTPKFLRAIAHRANAAPLLGDLLAPDRKQDLVTYLWGMEVIDFLTEHPSARFTPEEFVGLLTKLQPRLYSVASSLKAYPEQVHFIVDVVRYESHGRLRKGVWNALTTCRFRFSPA
jgi:sulfite reductase (NADPH) flavoprotein alpha-component